jgi:methylenetetrahydrofolate--tRNA-(uracil-5-)-methyltransferase
MSSEKTVHIIGGGLAGSEAAYQVARRGGRGGRGGRAILYEMKPARFSPAHTLPTLAELVCSNSLKSDDPANASGLLKVEMRLMDSLIMRSADKARVPAGKTLAVDRVEFSKNVTEGLAEAGVEVVRVEIKEVPASRPLVIATGPLTTDELAGSVHDLIGVDNLYFFDAVAPIVYKDSIDMTRTFFATRYGKGPADYLNCPLYKEEYERFIGELTKADRTTPRAFEDTPYFEGCMPIEAMAERGPKTLAFGPMRPVGLIDPRTNRRPYAVVQLRRENREGTLYNMVGFQTQLKFGEQKRIFRLIPGLERAEFARLGKLHRNTYIKSPALLSPAQELKSEPGVFFAGQITGVEGYSESALSGLMAGINALRAAEGLSPVWPPPSTMTGALMDYIATGGGDGRRAAPFQPMNANFGLLPAPPPDPGVKKREKRREVQAHRALKDLAEWINLCLAT